MKLFTIGFTKKNARRFFETLRASGAKRVVDVRLNNVSQLAGFAKKDDLVQERRIEDTIPREVVADGCLLCSEDKPDHCHRRVVAEYFRQHWGSVEIAHL